MLEFIDKLDKALFLILNGFHSPFWDNIMWIISAKITWIPLYLFIIYLFIRKYNIKAISIIISVILLIILADQLAVHAFKDIFQRLRPCHNPDLSGLVHIVNNKCGGSFGFVSNHAANTFALAAFSSAFLKNKYYIPLIFFWAFLVSYSRIYLGVHYPGDVIGGAALGILLAWGILYLYKLLKKKFEI